MMDRFARSPIQQIINSDDIEPFCYFQKFNKIRDLITFFDSTIANQVQKLLDQNNLQFTGQNCIPEVDPVVLQHIGSRNQIYYDFNRKINNIVISCEPPKNIISFTLSPNSKISQKVARALLSANQLVYSKYTLQIPESAQEISQILTIQNEQKTNSSYVQSCQRVKNDYYLIEKKVYYKLPEISIQEFIIQLCGNPPDIFQLFGYKKYLTVDFNEKFTNKPLYQSNNMEKLYRVSFLFQFSDSLNLQLHSNISCKIKNYPVKITKPDCFIDVFDMYLNYPIEINKESFNLTTGNIPTENWLQTCKNNFTIAIQTIYTEMSYDQKQLFKEYNFGLSPRDHCRCFLAALEIINTPEIIFTLSDIQQSIQSLPLHE